MSHKQTQLLSLWDLRRNLPAIRAGLKRGVQYVILYRGKPVGELVPPSKKVLDQVFRAQKKSREGAVRIRQNVARRRKERVMKRRGR